MKDKQADINFIKGYCGQMGMLLSVYLQAMEYHEKEPINVKPLLGVIFELFRRKAVVSYIATQFKISPFYGQAKRLITKILYSGK